MSQNDNLHTADGITNIENETISQVPETTANPEIEAVSEIENSNAAEAEQEQVSNEVEIEEKNYSELSIQELVSEFNTLLKNHKVHTISKYVNAIKNEFNSKFNKLVEEKREEFVADGGNPIDFFYKDDTKQTFNQLSREYKTSINNYYKERELVLKQNLENRLTIIEAIKALVGKEGNFGDIYKTFKDLQDKWRNAGSIPKDKYNNAWNSYHHHVERFYDFLHLSNDFRDLDFKHNYDQKIKIIDRAEALAKDDNINRAFRELQDLHRIWKEELGPVPKEHRDAIWERFSNATKTIHDKRQAYYADLDKAYEKNLVKKEEIIASILTIAQDQPKSHNAWQKNIKSIEALREDFFNAGKVPLKDNETTWAKFKAAVRDFNQEKNNFYKSLKNNQQQNLEKKKALIQIAEDNKDSEDFETVTALMKKIQSDWKKIGHVPRKDSDIVWKQFKDACNYFFDRLHKEREAENQHLYEALDKKTALLEALNDFKLSGDTQEDISSLKAKISEWKSVGFVPQNKRSIDGKFFKAIDNLFDQLKIEKDKLDMVKFESKLENLTPNGDDTRLLDNEQNFIKTKINDVKSEINQLENNLQFFSNVKADNPLVKDVHKNIEKHKNELELWKKKLKKVRSLYQN